MRNAMRAPVAALVAASLSGSGVPFAFAAPDKVACVTGYDAGQKLRGDKRLRAARKELLVCVADSCPTVVRKDCGALLAEVDASIPTIVVTLRDLATGSDVAEAKVELDGEKLVDKLDGTSVSVDPGKHKLRVTAAGHDPIEQEFVFVEGQKNRLITLEVGKKPDKAKEPPKEPPPPNEPPKEPEPKAKEPPPAAPPAPPPSAGAPAGAWILGGVGLISIGAFVGLGLSGRKDVSDLRASCAGACADSVLDTPKRKLLFADISLGVGVVSLGIATVLFLQSPKSNAPTSGLRVDLVPIASGGLGVLGGRF